MDDVEIIVHNTYEDAINDLTTLLAERTKNRPTNLTTEDINGGIWYAIKHLQQLQEEAGANDA